MSLTLLKYGLNAFSVKKIAAAKLHKTYYNFDEKKGNTD
jgi:hypothetical protein